jgi:hypothetical protein
MAEVGITWLNNQSTHLNRSYKAYAVLLDETNLADTDESMINSDYVDLSEFDKVDIAIAVSGIELYYNIEGSLDGETWYSSSLLQPIFDDGAYTAIYPANYSFAAGDPHNIHFPVYCPFKYVRFSSWVWGTDESGNSLKVTAIGYY